MFKIYTVTNKINGKTYVGKTSNSIECRWGQHTSQAKHDSSQYFCKAIRKHGSKNFEIKELDCTENEQQANWLESFYIGVTQSYKPEIGYNRTMGGDGVISTEETRQKQSIAKKGKLLSEEHKQKISLSNIGRIGFWKGKTFSDGHRQKISTATMGNKSNTGKHLSEDTKKKIGAANTGEKNILFGKHPSDETRRKQSIAHKGKPWSVARRAAQDNKKESLGDFSANSPS